MKVIIENRATNVNINQMIKNQEITDQVVSKIECAVMDYYKCSLSELKSWCNSSEAQSMVCFLQHHLLGYSSGYLAKRYNVYKGYLRNKFREFFERCLCESDFKDKVDYLKRVIANKELQSTNQDVRVLV